MLLITNNFLYPFLVKLYKYLKKYLILEDNILQMLNYLESISLIL